MRRLVRRSKRAGTKRHHDRSVPTFVQTKRVRAVLVGVETRHFLHLLLSHIGLGGVDVVTLYYARSPLDSPPNANVIANVCNVNVWPRAHVRLWIWTRSGSARLGAQISPPQTLKVSGITPPMRTHDYSNDLNSSGTAAPASTCGSSASASPAFLHGLLRIAHVEKFDLLKVSIRP